MIERTRKLSETVEYWSLSTNPSKGTAEIEFLRPGGGRINFTVPISHLADLKRDIDRESAAEINNLRLL